MDAYRYCTWHYGISAYLSKVYGAWCDATLKYEDAAGTVTTKDLAKQYRYTIKLRKLIKGVSFNNFAIVQTGTSSQVSILDFTTKSSPPLEGNFIVSCPNADGSAFDSREFGVSHWAEGIQFYLNLDIPHLMQKIEVKDTGKCAYR